MTFTGFPESAWPLLAAAGQHDLAWYRRNRRALQDDVVTPARALVTDLGPPLHQLISPRLMVDPRINKSLAPLTNDARFPHRPPVKGYLDLRFTETGADPAGAPVLLLRLAPGSVRFGCGARFLGSGIDTFRDAVAGPLGPELAEILSRLEAKPEYESRPPELARVPRGYDADAPQADLLRHRSLQVAWTEPAPRVITSGRFVGWCARRLVDLGDLHRWLCSHTRSDPVISD